MSQVRHDKTTKYDIYYLPSDATGVLNDLYETTVEMDPKRFSKWVDRKEFLQRFYSKKDFLEMLVILDIIEKQAPAKFKSPDMFKNYADEVHYRPTTFPQGRKVQVDESPLAPGIRVNLQIERPGRTSPHYFPNMRIDDLIHFKDPDIVDVLGEL